LPFLSSFRQGLPNSFERLVAKMFMCQSLLILNEFSLGAVLLFWPERLCLPETRQDCQIFANRLMAKHLNDWWPKNIYSMNHLLSLN
jgi:hypothetical protein